MLQVICVWIVVAQLFRIVWPWIFRNFIGPKWFGGKINFKKYGEWACVTGASDGIGKEFAKQLASKGLNVVLISRSLNKLKNVADDIERQHKVKTMIIDVDFTTGLEIYQKIEQKIKSLDIGILVNNVGIGYPGPLHFHELAVRDNYLWDILACNVISISFMTKQVMPNMLKKKCGLILNTSSLAGRVSLPVCLYSATKAYVDKFTEDFNLEYQDKGIFMQAFNAGPVITNMWTSDGGEWVKPTAQVYVASALQCIGFGRLHSGYYPHALLQLFAQTCHFCFPYFYDKIVWYFHRKVSVKSS